MFTSPHSRMHLLAVLVWALSTSSVVAQVFDERFTDWPVQLTIGGRIVVAGDLDTLEPLEGLLGDSFSESRALLVCSEQEEAQVWLERYEEYTADISVVENWSEMPGDTNIDFIAWHSSTSSPDLPSSEVQDRLRDFVDQGNTLVGVGPNAGHFASAFVVAAGPTSDAAQPTRIATGIGLIPDSVLMLDFQAPEIGTPKKRDTAMRTTSRSKLMRVLVSEGNYFGIGLETGTALMLSGRKFRVAGDGGASFLLAGNTHLPPRVEHIVPRRSRRQRPYEWMVDLTEWRRDRIDRLLEPFPPKTPYKPIVDNGTLFIVGGGGMPEGLMDQFVEAAGGVEHAKLVYVPCSEAQEVGASQRTVESWRKMGVQHATFIHTKNRIRANEDEEFFAPLKDATGIWFGGGRQWNFADSYYGTTTHRLMKGVLARGGAIGGSSAGASIQGRYLARATPIENFRIMAPGYERGGLGFLGGVAIDQHFTQRGRQKDMTQLVDKYPQLLGIGIDEATAIIVTKSTARVVGRGKVHFYDRRVPVVPEQDDFIALSAGQCFDLVERAECKCQIEEAEELGEESR